MNATIRQEKVRLKTYKTGVGNEVPYFIEKKQYQGACGKVYPLQVVDQLSDEFEEKEYQMVFLENDHISVHLLPEIGGKIYGAVARKDNYEFIYENKVVKPALIGLAGPWVSGGVEFNWPQHHRPTTYSPAAWEIRENPDGSVTCFMGELEPFEHMRGMTAITVYPGRSLVEGKAIVTNCTDHALPFMWWNNTAVRVHEQYKAIFPPDVEYGSDHDRRAIIPFPVMKGKFETARPYDYGEGVDTSWFGNVKVPTSVMIPRGETKMDFLAGYDYKGNAGTVIISDHHISPGKKMFTWGDSEFGKKWCGNLTDNDDRYIELMTGVYTDNQPDFAYIEPGETKEFVTFWYPVRGLGGVSNANTEGALLLEKESDTNQWKIGAITTKSRKDGRLTLKSGDNILYEKSGSLEPDDYWLAQIVLPDPIKAEELTLTFKDETGKELISYQPPIKGKKQPPKPRAIVPDPQEVESSELLYLYGRHLAQYKHGTYRAEDYYREALKRCPEDYRCNLEMGKLETEKGNFAQAHDYLKAAMHRLTVKNTSPQDSEIYYQMGRLLRLQGKSEEAYGYFRAAAWQYAYRSPAYFESACISSGFGCRERAVSELREAISTNTRFYAARTLLGYLTKDAQLLRQNLKEFPLDGSAQYALFLLTGEAVDESFRQNPQEVLEAALLFRKAGLKEEAIKILKDCSRPSLNLLFHIEELTGEKAGEASLSYYMPNRLEDISALSREDWRAQYLLGCLYYARENYEAAAKAFHKSLEGNDRFGYTWRNLAIACYDHLGQKEASLPYMRKALTLNPDDARLVYELMQLEKAENLSISVRTALTDTYRTQVIRRDDAWLDAIILRMLSGSYEEAAKMLQEKSFHIYEGGEGKLTKYHRWLHILMAAEKIAQKDYTAAGELFDQALIYPSNYGEGKGFLEQDANVYYFAGLLREKTGKEEEAKRFYEKAEEEPELVNEILFFTGLCEEKLGHRERAEHHFHLLLEEGEKYAAHPHRYGYFGVGMESPLPFESDIQRNNLTKAYLLRMLAYKGLKKEAAFEGEKRKLAELDPGNSLLIFLEKLEII